MGASRGPSDLEEALRSCDVLHAAVELECLLLVASRLASARVHRSQLAERVAYERHCHRHRVRHLVREALEVAQRRVDRREGGGRVEAERHHVRLGQVTLARVWVREISFGENQSEASAEASVAVHESGVHYLLLSSCDMLYPTEESSFFSIALVRAAGRRKVADQYVCGSPGNKPGAPYPFDGDRCLPGCLFNASCPSSLKLDPYITTQTKSTSRALKPCAN